MWLGPPAMNRKMTDFALAGLCGGFGASGLADCAQRSLLRQHGAESQCAETAEGVA